MSSHFTTLQSIGLSDKEASVYLALLELGGANAQTISTQSKVKRGTVYTILDTLMKKGLASTAEKGGKQMFFPEDPSKLEALLEEKRRALARAEEEARDTVQDLRRLHISRGTRPVVRYFEGVEGLENIVKDMQNTLFDEAMTFTNLDALLRIFPDMYKVGNVTHRIKNNRKAFTLYTSKHGVVGGMDDPEKLRHALHVSFHKNLAFEGDISIYGNKVSISSFKTPPISILIEHEDIARLMEALFTLALEGAEERGEQGGNGITLESIDRGSAL